MTRNRSGYRTKEQSHLLGLISQTTAAATRDPADAPRTQGAVRSIQGA